VAKKEPKPVEPKRWNRRPWPHRGDADMNVLYAAVGRFMSQWERYEGVLSLLFSAFVSDLESKAARRAYASVRTFEGRAEMLRASSAAYFEEHPSTERQDSFKIILTDATQFSPRRNDVAHGVLDYYFPEDHHEHSEPIALDLEYGLYPSYASFKERDLANVPTYCYTSVELNYFWSEFVRLGTEASLLVGQILNDRKRPSLRRHYEPGPG
jgi:hypothetical protein